MKYFGWTTHEIQGVTETTLTKKERLSKRSEQFMKSVRQKQDLQTLSVDNQEISAPGIMSKIEIFGRKTTFNPSQKMDNNIMVVDEGEDIYQMGAIESTRDKLPYNTVYKDRVDKAILKSAYEDKKFMKFYETKFNLTTDAVSPFQHDEDKK